MITKVVSGILIFGGIVIATIGKIINPEEILFQKGIVTWGFSIFCCGIFILITKIMSDMYGD